MGGGGLGGALPHPSSCPACVPPALSPAPGFPGLPPCWGAGRQSTGPPHTPPHPMDGGPDEWVPRCLPGKGHSRLADETTRTPGSPVQAAWVGGWVLTASIGGAEAPTRTLQRRGVGGPGVLRVQGCVPRHTPGHRHPSPADTPPPDRDHPHTPMHTRGLLARPDTRTTHTHTWKRRPEEQPETTGQTDGPCAVYTQADTNTRVCAQRRPRTCGTSHTDGHAGTRMSVPMHKRVCMADTHIRVPMHTYVHAGVCSHADADPHTAAYMCVYPCTHRRTHRHAHTCVAMHTPTHAHVSPCTHRSTQIREPLHTRVRTNAHMDAHTHAYPRRHRSTHVCVPTQT